MVFKRSYLYAVNKLENIWTVFSGIFKPVALHTEAVKAESFFEPKFQRYRPRFRNEIPEVWVQELLYYRDAFVKL